MSRKRGNWNVSDLASKSYNWLWRNRRRKQDRLKNRPARFESLESRTMLAADSFGAIAGVAFDDLNNDGLFDAGEELAGATIKLYEDTGSIGVLDGEASSATATTGADGSYSFTGLEAGDYLVEHTTLTGLLTKPGTNVRSVTISTLEAEGTIGVEIDAFIDGMQSVVDPPISGSPSESSVTGASILGGDRDMYVDASAGSVGLSAGGGTLEFSSSFTGVGTRLVTWDGLDGDPHAIDPTGLGDIDLTSGGSNVGILLGATADLPGATATLRVYSSATDFSEASVAIPVSATPESIILDFGSDFFASGAGADFEHVGAIQLEIAGAAGADGVVTVIGAIGDSTHVEDFASYEPLSLGSVVWHDANDNGLNDDPAPSASGDDFSGWSVNLYEDSFTPGDTPIATVTTNSEGEYLFEDLFPGDYVVQLDPALFGSGGDLEGVRSSTGVVSDPNTDINDDDNGDPLTVGGEATDGILTGIVALMPNTEPTDDGDVDPDSNLSVDFGLVAEVDLEITKEVSEDTAAPLDTLVYTLTITNHSEHHGPDSMTVTDSLPDGVTFVSAVGEGGETFSESELTSGMILGGLDSLGTYVVTVTVTVDSDSLGVLENTAEVTGDLYDPVLSNNTDSATTSVESEIDLSITKSDDVDPVIAGEELTYTITVANDGPSTATEVAVIDSLPSGVTFVSAVGEGGETYSESDLTSGMDIGDLSDGASYEITVTVLVDSSFVVDWGGGGVPTLTNHASVEAEEFDAFVDNNSTSEDTEVDELIDLAIDKSDWHAEPAIIGEEFFYMIDVTNIGPSDATGVVVTDELPDGLIFVSGSNPDGSPVEFDSGVITAEIGDLAAGGHVSVNLTVTTDPDMEPTMIVNSASVVGDQDEVTLDNNVDSEETHLERPPASISGFVYVDEGISASTDGNGDMDSGEMGIPGVTVTLIGMDIDGNSVSMTTMTDAMGHYRFDGLRAGTYHVMESQPALFDDGIDSIGSHGGDLYNDLFAGIEIEEGEHAVDYNFGEESSDYLDALCALLGGHVVP